MAIIEVSIVPVGTGSSSLSKFVAQAVKVLQGEKDIRYELTSMGTIIEGDLDKVLSLVRKMHESVFGQEVRRAVTTVKIDDRRDRPSSMSAKVDSVKKLLEHG